MRLLRSRAGQSSCPRICSCFYDAKGWLFVLVKKSRHEKYFSVEILLVGWENSTYGLTLLDFCPLVEDF